MTTNSQTIFNVLMLTDDSLRNLDGTLVVVGISGPPNPRSIRMSSGSTALAASSPPMLRSKYTDIRILHIQNESLVMCISNRGYTHTHIYIYIFIYNCIYIYRILFIETGAI